MFNKQELQHWLIARSVHLPIEKCIDVLDEQQNLNLLRDYELAQVMRIYDLFARFDLMLVMLTISSQPYHQDITQQLRLTNFANIHQLLKATTHLKNSADFGKWPVNEADYPLAVDSSIFSAECIGLLTDSLINKTRKNQRLEQALIEELIPVESKNDLLSHTSNEDWVKELQKLKFKSDKSKRALLKNPLFSKEKRNSFQYIHSRDRNHAMKVMHDHLIDMSVYYKGDYFSAYLNGWKPGKFFAYAIKEYPIFARTVLTTLPSKVQADLILFAFQTYGRATPDLLGSAVSNELVTQHLLFSQEKSLDNCVRLANKPNTTLEIPPLVLGTILSYSSDKVNNQIRSYVQSGNCRLISEHYPSPIALRNQLEHLKKSFSLELEALLRSIETPKFMFYKRLRIASMSGAYAGLLFLCGIMIMVIKGITGTNDLFRLDIREGVALFILKFLGYMIPPLATSFIFFGISALAEHRLNQMNYLNADSLNTPLVRKQQTQFQESAQLLTRVIRFMAPRNQDYLVFLFEDLQQQLSIIKQICELIRTYQAGSDTNLLRETLKKAPFSSERILPDFIYLQKMLAFNYFFTTIQDKDLYVMRNNPDLIERISRYRNEHPFPEPKPWFWQVARRRQQAREEHDDDIELDPMIAAIQQV